MSDDDGRVSRRLADLVDMVDVARGLAEKGVDAYLADDLAGRTLRLAGRQLVIQVATVAEKLPDDFKAQYPDVEWVKVQRMRNLVAHHYDRVLDEFVWETLRSSLPRLVSDLGLTPDPRRPAPRVRRPGQAHGRPGSKA